jgi:hypothetical protein
MYVVEADDYAQTSLPREESDGAVKMFWDHPDYPGIWSGQCCDRYPYDDWTDIAPITARTSFGVWSWFRILLLEFDLRDKEEFLSPDDLLRLSPDNLRSLNEPIYTTDLFSEPLDLIIPDFSNINAELIEYFSRHPEALTSLHWRKFEELLEEVFKNQGFITVLGSGNNDQGIDLRLLQKDVIGEIITLVQAKRYKADAPIELDAVSALYGAVQVENAQRGLFVTTSRYLPSARQFANRVGGRLILAGPDEVAKWCARFRDR